MCWKLGKWPVCRWYLHGIVECSDTLPLLFPFSLPLCLPFSHLFPVFLSQTKSAFLTQAWGTIATHKSDPTVDWQQNFEPAPFLTLAGLSHNRKSNSKSLLLGFTVFMLDLMRMPSHHSPTQLQRLLPLTLDSSGYKYGQPHPSPGIFVTYCII